MSIEITEKKVKIILLKRGHYVDLMSKCDSYSFFCYDKTGEKLCFAKAKGDIEKKSPGDLVNKTELTYFQIANKKQREFFENYQKLIKLEKFIIDNKLDIKPESKSGKKIEIIRYWLIKNGSYQHTLEDISVKVNLSESTINRAINIFKNLKENKFELYLINETIEIFVKNNPGISCRNMKKKLKEEKGIPRSRTDLNKYKNK